MIGFGALFLACVAERPTLQALVEVRAEALAAQASADLRPALGAGAVVAATCALDQRAWLALEGDTPALDPRVEARLGVTPGSGRVSFDQGSGALSLRWATASPFPDEVHALELQVVRAGEAFVLALTPADEDGRDGALRVEVLDCAEPVDLTLAGTLGEADLRLPAGDDAALWPAGGEGLPSAGVARWALDDAGVVRSEDAAAIAGGLWPATASARDWDHPVDLELDP